MADVLKNHLEAGNRGRVVLLGYPYDEGVARVGGRTGARRGPDRFRAWFRRYGSVDNPQLNLSLASVPVTDAGDLPAGLPLEKAHETLKDTVSEILQHGGRPFVVGGGNDQSYPNASALLSRWGEGRVGVVNIDAHLDVRPKIEGRVHSGSPFRLLLEDGRFSGRHFVEFACQGAQCSAGHARFVQERGGEILWLDSAGRGDALVDRFQETLDRLAGDVPALFVSFDLDAVRAAEAPGVSCPGVLGLTAAEALRLAFAAGAHPAVRLFDLSEYNPEIEDERTGRLAVALFYHFCLGLARQEAAS